MLPSQIEISVRMDGSEILAIQQLSRIINPDKLSGGVVRALDVDRDLGGPANNAYYLANQLKTLAKKDKRISYIIFNHKIASRISLWKWRKYRGSNPHTSHVHISFTPLGDQDKRKFKLPILGE